MSAVMSAFGITSNNDSEDGNNMKNKVLETWNNFRFELSAGINLRKDSPIWVLGKCYLIQSNDETTPSLDNETQQTDKKKNMKDNFRLFMMDYHSKIWLSYRKGFPPLPDTNLTSDTGWGCMLRTAQMMIAQGLVEHFLGREWRYIDSNHTLQQSRLHRQIVQYFLDESNQKCPFSLHTLTEIGLNYRCKPGNWYGPGTVAYIMQDAVQCGKGHNSDLHSVTVYVAQDCTVYKNDVMQICHWSHTTTEHNANSSVIILIPVRLGEAELNPIYIPCLKSMLSLRQSTGIIGGKPKHSLYFIGYQDDHVLYLDPHYCQQADSLAVFSNKQLENYHNTSPRKVHISKIDPSCCLSFYCRDLIDFENFTSEVNKCLSSTRQKPSSYPLCLIVEGSASEVKLENSPVYKTISSPLKSDEDSEFTEINLDGNADINIHGNTDINIRGNTGQSCSGEHKTPPTEQKEEGLNLQSAKKLFTNFYRSVSKNSKSEKNGEKSLEEEFELL